MEVTTFLGHLANDLLPIFAAAFLTLAAYAVHKLAVKIQIDQIAGAEDLLNNAVHKGIDYAEAWAAKQAIKPMGDTKLAVALNLIETIVGDPLFKTYGADHMQKLVEAALQSAQGTAPAKSVTANTQVLVTPDPAASATTTR